MNTWPTAPIRPEERGVQYTALSNIVTVCRTVLGPGRGVHAVSRTKVSAYFRFMFEQQHESAAWTTLLKSTCHLETSRVNTLLRSTPGRLSPLLVFFICVLMWCKFGELKYLEKTYIFKELDAWNIYTGVHESGWVHFPKHSPNFMLHNKHFLSAVCWKMCKTEDVCIKIRLKTCFKITKRNVWAIKKTDFHWSSVKHVPACTIKESWMLWTN